MRTMEFASPIDTGNCLISTVRRGIKWANLKVGERIKTEEVTGKGVAVLDDRSEYRCNMTRGQLAEVVSVKVKNFAALDKSDFLDNFDPDCRTFRGLEESMSKIYPEFDRTEIVTIVRLRVLEDE